MASSDQVTYPITTKGKTISNDVGIPENLFNERYFLAFMFSVWVFVQMITLFKNYQIYNLYQEPFFWKDLIAPRICAIGIGIFLLAGTWQISRHLIKYEFTLTQSVVIHLIGGISLSFISFAAVQIMLRFMPFVTLPSRSILKYYLMEMDRQVLIYLFFASFCYAYFFFKSYRQKNEAQLILLQHLGYERIQALVKQMDPHLYSNYLSGIGFLLQKDQDKASRMIYALTDWTSKHLEHNEVWVTLRKEFEFTSSYLELEKIRYGDHLKFKINCAIEHLHLQVPHKIIQPLVENAIKHGWRKAEDFLEIQVNVSVINNYIGIYVTNNGRPLSSQKMSNKNGVGLNNIKSRLSLLYEGNYQLKLYNDSNTNRVTCALTIPLIKANQYQMVS